MKKLSENSVHALATLLVMIFSHAGLAAKSEDTKASESPVLLTVSPLEKSELDTDARVQFSVLGVEEDLSTKLGGSYVITCLLELPLFLKDPHYKMDEGSEGNQPSVFVSQSDLSAYGLSDSATSASLMTGMADFSSLLRAWQKGGGNTPKEVSFQKLSNEMMKKFLRQLSEQIHSTPYLKCLNRLNDLKIPAIQL